MATFKPADILVPQVENMEKWAVIACDQYTSQPEYWDRVKEYVGEEPSSLHLILPEAKMSEMKDMIPKINKNMDIYLERGVFKEYKNSYIYVERKLRGGDWRRGIVGMVDLEEYDYSDNASTDIRATERTVEERIPPRMMIRENASLELPHILLLCDDEKQSVLDTAEALKDKCPKLYDFDLMENGSHISGWLIQGDNAEMLNKQIEEYEAHTRKKHEGIKQTPMLYAVGDGNHSLATAKACYEMLKKNNRDIDFTNHPARYALLELENLHDSSQRFKAIHRIVSDIDVEELISKMKEKICADEGHMIKYCVGDKEGILYLDKKLGEIPVAILQKFLDEYLKDSVEKIDYIHGESVVRELAKRNNSIGFILPVIEKAQLFRGIAMDGVLPRKTFSIGHAEEKRYYLEVRKINDRRK